MSERMVSEREYLSICDLSESWRSRCLKAERERDEVVRRAFALERDDQHIEMDRALHGGKGDE